MKTNSPGEALTALKDSFPIMISVASYGAVFGFLARQSGLSSWQAQGMSVLVFAGSSQLVALPLMAAGASALLIIGTTFVVNARHLLMSSTLIGFLRNLPRRWLAFVSWWITDESFALSVARYKRFPADPWYLFGAGLAVFLSWNISTLIGYHFGAVIPDPDRWHLDFIVYAAFIGLAVPMIGERRDLLVAAAAAVISVIAALLLPGFWYILIAGLTAPALAVWGEGS
jgi:4-azaleucine resistance transporter AzlC